jgi:MFS family permease
MSQPEAVAADTRKARKALLALNFFSADQTGIGPFFGVFLAQNGWRTGLLGTVMTVGGLVGLLMTAPAGALADRTTRKRTFVILSSVFTIAASLLIWWSQSFWVVASSQVAGAIAGSIIGPAMLGITLGVVKQEGFNAQNGRNQAYNHAGNVAGAAICGFLGWKFGFGMVFLMGVVLGTLSVISTLAIPKRAIDDRAGRGLAGRPEDGDQVQGLQVLVENKALMVLALCVALFALGNGAMLPLYGLAVVQAHKADPAIFAATVVIVAQTTMVATSLIAMRLIEARGYWTVMLITFACLPIRGVLAALLITSWGVFPVQIMDGVGAGLQGVAVSGLVTRLLYGTGRVNVGQGTVGTVAGIGGTLSPLLCGWLAQWFGYPVTFVLAGSLSLIALVIWLAFARTIKTACEAPQRRDKSAAPAAPEAAAQRA